MKKNIQKLIRGIQKLEKQNENFLHLTANENILSNTANYFLSSKLSERYFFGGGKDRIVDFNPFTIQGLPEIEDLVNEAEKALKKMTNAKAVNLSCLSGIHTMLCVILATTKPNDLIMTIRPSDGGHFATESILNLIGRRHSFIPFDIKSLQIDFNDLKNKLKDETPKLIYIDLMYYINSINIEDIKKLIGNDVIIVYDASHTIGLILGNRFQSPLEEGADIICANTHKTLPGPHKGLIAYKSLQLGNKINQILAGKLYSSVHTHHLIALAITILEMYIYGTKYARNVVLNSNYLGEAFLKLGYNVRENSSGNYSDNHQVHVFLEGIGKRIDMYRNLIDNNISTNFDNVLGGKLFMRLGTQEITRRGMQKDEMCKIADFVDKAFKGKNVKNTVINFNNKFRKILYSFDENSYS